MTIRDPEAVAQLIADVWRDFGALYILVNNAGGQFPQAAIDFTAKGWNAVIDTNLSGPWYMMQHAARFWRDHSMPGVIVNVVAVVFRGMPGVAHTCAARAGVIHASKTVAIEWAPLNIRGQLCRSRHHRHRGHAGLPTPKHSPPCPAPTR